MQVRVRNYNLIDDDVKQLGVIAQELETIFPSMVDENEDRDSEGNFLGTTTKGVKYSVFVPVLIKAMQEQTEWTTKLMNDASFTDPIPSNQADFVALVTAREDYSTRTERDAAAAAGECAHGFQNKSRHA